MNKRSFAYIIVSAGLFGISPPLAKLLLKNISPIVLAGLLYLGAFCGLYVYSVIRKIRGSGSMANVMPLQSKDYPWLVGAIVSGGIIAPISMMLGLKFASGFSASLFLNLEGAATALIAAVIFKEHTGKRLWLAVACMTVASLFLTWDPAKGRFTIIGPFLLIVAMICWGMDNNLTRKISGKDPVQIAMIKGFLAGSITTIIAVIFGLRIPLGMGILYALLLGTFSYGISLVFFIKALEGLGSSRAGAFFSLGPFVGAITSLFIFNDWLGWVIVPATLLMVIGVSLLLSEKHIHLHIHGITLHAHPHRHDDLHHQHAHSFAIQEPHTHEHTHPGLAHTHEHRPDSHHNHDH
ncbi:MAG: EamA family transporter [Candidatus Zixiibacteriota bacterium]